MAILRAIICLNGNLPQKKFFDHYKYLPIIAADGAADKLLQIAVTPTYIIGDFDSLRRPVATYSASKLIKKPDQNYTDFEKLISVAREINLLPTIICGIFGGESDHILNNISCFLRYNQEDDQGNKLFFYDQEIDGGVKWGKALIAKHQAVSLRFTADKDELISIIAYSETIISATGLKWELDHHQLSLTKQSAIRNRAIGGEVNIDLHSGMIILITSKQVD